MNPRQTDYVGKNVEVGNIHGTIIDETKNVIIIRAKGKIKKFIKKNHIFKIQIDNKTYEIKGNEITERPQERV